MLFLQAIVLEAGAGIVLIGVAVGPAATPAVGYLTIRLQRKLPHKKMLVATGARAGARSSTSRSPRRPRKRTIRESQSGHGPA